MFEIHVDRDVPQRIARLGNYPVEQVQTALDHTNELWIIDRNIQPAIFGHVLLQVGLWDRVPVSVATELHAELFSQLCVGKPQDWAQALEHAQQARGLVEPDEISELAQKAGY